MTEGKRAFLPAAGRDWALPLYDPIVKLLGGETARRTLLEQAQLASGHRVLDIGCGTGTMVTLLKRLHPSVDVVGIDPDPKALARAKKKAERAGISARFDKGFSDDLPYADGLFDRVLSSFMFHHLEQKEKEKTLRDVKRVLVPGGSLHLMDFVPTDGSANGWRAHFIRAHAHLKENSDSRLIQWMTDAGLASAKRVAEGRMFFGFLRVGYYEAFLER